MNFLNNNARGILAIIAVLSVIIGFFMGMVSSEVFSATIGMIITHFYQSGKVNELSKKVESQEVEIQSLRNG